MGSMGGRGMDRGGRVTRPKQPSGPSNFSNILISPTSGSTTEQLIKVSEYFSTHSPCIIIIVKRTVVCTYLYEFRHPTTNNTLTAGTDV